jgi:hypothetical protein
VFFLIEYPPIFAAFLEYADVFKANPNLVNLNKNPKIPINITPASIPINNGFFSNQSDAPVNLADSPGTPPAKKEASPILNVNPCNK